MSIGATGWPDDPAAPPHPRPVGLRIRTGNPRGDGTNLAADVESLAPRPSSAGSPSGRGCPANTRPWRSRVWLAVAFADRTLLAGSVATPVMLLVGRLFVGVVMAGRPYRWRGGWS